MNNLYGFPLGDPLPMTEGKASFLDTSAFTDRLPDIPGIDDEKELAILGVQVDAQDYFKMGLLGALAGTMFGGKEKTRGALFGVALGFTLSWLSARSEANEGL